MKKKNSPKVGDWVVIVDPRLFVRCGYELTPESVRNDVLRLYDKELAPFRKVFGIGLYFQPNSCDAFDKIVYQLCYHYVHKQDFGGRERKIFQGDAEEKLRGVTVQICEIKRIVTGLYNPGYRCGSYDDPWEYSPPYLSKQKHHTVYSFFPNGQIVQHPLWILAENVRA